MSQTKPCTEIEDLPDEVLEFILSLIPPYKDLHDCLQVSKRWRRCVLNVAKTKLRNLHKAIIDFDIRWNTLTPVELAPTISKRYSHNAVIHDNSMYVFGGCTCSMTTFNDLWRLDLSKRQWVRPVAMGDYPTPKACSSLVCYKDLLVLFGGWAYPPSYPLYQSWHLFNELHVYDITANRWTCVNTTNAPPPPTAGHSVSVVGEWMIMFGGIHKPNSAVHCEKSNDVWKLNLETWTWHKQEVQAGPAPNGRLGQTQVLLNDQNILIVGGSGGPTLSYCDVWILNMEGPIWRWRQVDIDGKSNKPVNIWTNPGCKIGDKIVVLNRVREDQTIPIVYYPKNSWVNRRNPPEDNKFGRIDLANRQLDRDENVNGRRGVLRNHKREAEEDLERPGCSSNQRPDLNNIIVNQSSSPMNMLAAFNVPNRARADKVREQRLARLCELKENMKKRRDEKTRSHYLGIYVLDLSRALEAKPLVTWLPPKKFDSGPEETILYTLLKGKSELVMFGGIRKDPTSLGFSINISNQISNTLHFISAPNYVI